jgi:hypothetical protein
MRAGLDPDANLLATGAECSAPIHHTRRHDDTVLVGLFNLDAAG